MIKRFCKRSIAIILTVITLVSLIPLSLFSVEAANVNLNLDICQGKRTSGANVSAITAVNAASFQREGGYAWKITNGNGEYVYCIEPGVHLSWDDTMSTTSTESAWRELDDAQRDTINAILAFGADGNRDKVKTGCATDEYGGSGVLDDEVYVATQLLVWEVIKKARSAAWPYDSSSGGYLYLFCDNGTYPNIKASYNYILDSLKSFQTLPSFTKKFKNSAPTYTLDVKYNKDTGEYIYYSRELVDSNKVLSKFDFDGTKTINVGNADVTITQKGNKITLTPSNANKDKSSTSYSFGSQKNVVSPVPSNGKTTITVYASETAQDCIEGGSIDPPSAYFKVKVNIEEIEVERDFNLRKAVWTEEEIRDVLADYGSIDVVNGVLDTVVSSASTPENLEGWYFEVTLPSTATDAIKAYGQNYVILGPTDSTGYTGHISSALMKLNPTAYGRYNVPKGTYSVKELGKLDGSEYKIPIGWNVAAEIDDITLSGSQKDVTGYIHNQLRIPFVLKKSFEENNNQSTSNIYYLMTNNETGRQYRLMSDKSGYAYIVKDGTKNTKNTAVYGGFQERTYTKDGVHYNYIKRGTYTLIELGKLKEGATNYDDYENSYYMPEWWADVAPRTIEITPEKYAEGVAANSKIQAVYAEIINTSIIQITVQKDDGDTEGIDYLEGFQFGVYADEHCAGEPMEIITTAYCDECKKAVGHSEGRYAPGTYYLKEIKNDANKYYKVENDPIRIVLSPASNPTGVNQTVTIENFLYPAKVEVLKIDGDTETPLSGAIFKLYDSNKKLLETLPATNSSGKATTTNTYKPGNYYLQEYKMPEGYKADTTLKPITIDKVTSDGAVVTFERENTKKEAYVSVIKVDENNKSIYLSGAVFKMYSDSACTKEIDTLAETGTKGTYKTSKTHPFGTYYVKETVAPPGYQLNSTPVEVVIGKDVTDGAIVKHTSPIGNTPKEAYVQIKKVDDKGNTVSGAIFGLYSDSTCTKALETNINSASNGYAKSSNTYKPGTYYFKETKAPAGYDIDTSVYKVVIPNTVTHKDVVTCDKTAVNPINPSKVGVYKTVASTGEPLEGVVYALYSNSSCSSSYLLETLDPTDENGYAESQKEYPVGTYYFKEISCPDDFVVDTKAYSVTVEKNTTGKVFTINRTNQKKQSRLVIYKTDGVTFLPLAGAKFNVYDENDNFIQSIVSGEDGYAYMDKYYEIGTVLYFREIEYPEGYGDASAVAQKTKITLWNNTNTLKSDSVKTIRNYPSGNLIVYKYDTATGEPLKGVEFGIYTYNPLGGRYAWQSENIWATTNEEGYAVFEGVTLTDFYENAYYILEKEPLEGYVGFSGDLADGYNWSSLENQIDINSGNWTSQYWGASTVKFTTTYDYDSDISADTVALKATSCTGNGHARVYHDIPVDDLVVGGKYTLTAQVKTSDIVGNGYSSTYGARIAGTFYYNDGTAAKNNYSSCVVNTNGEYTTLSVTFVIPENLDYLRINLAIRQATGTATFTGVKLMSVDENGALVINAPNTKATANLYVKKIGDDGAPLAGAEFKLYNEDGSLVPLKNKWSNTATGTVPHYDLEGTTDITLKTYSSGKIFVGDLPYGKYYLVETKAPDGYISTNDKIPFEIICERVPGNGSFISYYCNDAELTVMNNKGGESSVTVVKQDSKTNEPLEGATFEMRKASENLLDTVIKIDTDNSNGDWTFYNNSYVTMTSIDSNVEYGGFNAVSPTSNSAVSYASYNLDISKLKQGATYTFTAYVNLEDITPYDSSSTYYFEVRNHLYANYPAYRFSSGRILLEDTPYNPKTNDNYMMVSYDITVPMDSNLQYDNISFYLYGAEGRVEFRDITLTCKDYSYWTQNTNVGEYSTYTDDNGNLIYDVNAPKAITGVSASIKKIIELEKFVEGKGYTFSTYVDIDSLIPYTSSITSYGVQLNVNFKKSSGAGSSSALYYNEITDDNINDGFVYISKDFVAPDDLSAYTACEITIAIVLASGQIYIKEPRLFENNKLDDFDSYKKAGWGTTTGLSFTTGVTDEVSLFGDESLYIDVTEAVSNGRGRVYKDIYGLEVGETYTLSAYVKAENIVPVEGVSTYGAVIAGTYFNSSGSAKGDQYSTYVNTNTEGFVKISRTFTIPDNIDFAKLRVNLALRSATGTVYFDEIKLEKKDNVITTFTTDSEGKASFEYVYDGPWELVEVSAPENYKLSNAIIMGESSNSFIVSNKTVTVYNDAQEGFVGISKADEYNRAVSGATYGLYTSNETDTNGMLLENNLICTVVTDDDGIGEFDTAISLFSTHFIQEVEAPIGYQLNKEIYEIQADSIVDVKYAGVTDETQKGYLVLDKKNTDGRYMNTEFELYDSEGKAVQLYEIGDNVMSYYGTDFEIPIPVNEMSYWSTVKNGTSDMLVDGNVSDNCLNITVDTIYGGMNGGLSSIVDASSFVPGNTYTISGYVSIYEYTSRSTSSNAGVYIQVENYKTETGNPINSYKTVPITNTTDGYAYISQDFTVDENADVIKVSLLTNTASTEVSFRDIKITGTDDYSNAETSNVIRTVGNSYETISNLPIGDYYLVETKTENEYLPYAEKIYFSIEPGDINSPSASSEIVKVINHKAITLDTGGEGQNLINYNGIIVLAMVILLGASYFVICKNIKKRKEF